MFCKYCGYQNVESYICPQCGKNLASSLDDENCSYNYTSMENKQCPYCDGVLVLRESKFGIFIGCSNYPECHYTEDLSHYKRGRKKHSTEQFTQHAEFVQWLKDNGIGQNAINTYVSGVKRYFDFLNNKSIPQKSPMPKPPLSDDDAYPNLKIGEIARTHLRECLTKGIPEYELNHLQQDSYCKEVFGLDFPLLVTNRMGERSVRYYKDPVNINGKRFYICSQWYETYANNDRPLLLAWLKKHQSAQNSNLKKDNSFILQKKKQ